jgi:hypothetical protein
MHMAAPAFRWCGRTGRAFPKLGASSGKFLLRPAATLNCFICGLHVDVELQGYDNARTKHPPKVLHARLADKTKPLGKDAQASGVQSPVPHAKVRIQSVGPTLGQSLFRRTLTPCHCSRISGNDHPSDGMAQSTA